MVQSSGDIERDIRNIIQTREHITENLEQLKTRIRSAVGGTTYRIGHAIDGITQTGERLQRSSNPYHLLIRYPVIILSVTSIIAYLVKSRMHAGRTSAHASKAHQHTAA